MRALMAALLLLSLAFAGCSDDGDDDPQPSATVSTSVSASTTASSAPVANRAPVANLTASALNGTVPLNVTFQINGTDADGDALTWTLRSGNDTLSNGTSLPANRTHAFIEPGNHTLVLTVSDGKLNATANVTINVTAASPALAPLDPPIHDEYEVAYFCELCTVMGPDNCISLNLGEPGIDCGWTELPPEAAGHAFKVVIEGLAFGNADIAFLATCDAGAAVIATQTASSAEEAGFVPAGAGCLVAWDYDGVEPLLPFVIDIV